HTVKECWYNSKGKGKGAQQKGGVHAVSDDTASQLSAGPSASVAGSTATTAATAKPGVRHISDQKMRILAVSGERQGYLLVDTGATVSVCRPDTFLEPVNTAARQTLYSVDDTSLDTKGTVEPVLKLGRRSRQEAKTTFQVVSGITDDILSVNRAVDAGARVVFDAAGSYIEWEDGSRADFIRSGRQFLMPYTCARRPHKRARVAAVGEEEHYPDDPEAQAVADFARAEAAAEEERRELAEDPGGSLESGPPPPDPEPAETVERALEAVVQMDYTFYSRGAQQRQAPEDESILVTVLTLVDRDTGWPCSVQVPKKGAECGNFVLDTVEQYLNTLGHSRVTLQIDSEGSLRSVATAIRRLLEEERWELVYTGWLQILQAYSSGSEIADILEEAQEEHAKVACVRQLFGGKALTTLEKRLRQARHYLKWAQETSSEAFPIGNHQVRMYIKQLLKDNAPPSKVRGACEIVNFLAYVVGLPVAVTATRTPWVKGVMRQSRSEKGAPKQARALTTVEVALLESMLRNEEVHVQDRFAAGAMLFMVYSRARYGDTKIVSQMIPDFVETSHASTAGYLELTSYSHKMRRVKAALPLVAPALGVGHVAWGPVFIKVADLAGAVLHWGCGVLAASEAFAKLRARSLESCLQAIRNSRFYPDMSRSGYLAVDERQDSCLEGSTQSGNLGSADSHALHAAAAAFATFGKQPAEQSVGPAGEVDRPTVEQSPELGESFNGDGDSEPRLDDLFNYGSEAGAGDRASLSEDDRGLNSNAFQGEGTSPNLAAPEPLGDDNDPSDDDPSSSSTSTSSSEAESNPGLPPVPTAPWRDGCVIWQHRRTRTLHLVSASDSQIGGTFACGRSITTAHVLASRNAHVASMRCSQCERGKHVRTTGAVLDALEAIKKRRH
ncbi:unnamed protein product, partial [Symbiodinium microadriaticum]